jgi:hypothetical protein
MQGRGLHQVIVCLVPATLEYDDGGETDVLDTVPEQNTYTDTS